MEKLDELKFKKITTNHARSIIGGSNSYCTQDTYGYTSGGYDHDVVDHRTETSDDTGKLVGVCTLYEK